jgi:outer membrane protein OmpA-like peptidoglycan-associated protein
MKLSFITLFVLAAAIWLPLDQSNNVSQTGTPAADTQNSTSPQSQPSQPSASDQNAAPVTQNQSSTDQTPVYRVTVVERTTQAVDYRDRGGTTQVDFKGTNLMPRVDGNAKVTGHTGRLAIDANLHHLNPPRTLGPEFLTYVLWAITPEGRAVNLGEIIPNDDGNSRLQVTSGLQVFGLIVTAEPYFAVSQPGDVVVAENIVRSDTLGGIHPIAAKFDLLRRGQYTMSIDPSRLPATSADPRIPLQLLEAENAIAIAEAAGANQYAVDTLGKAKAYLEQGQKYYQQKQSITPIGAVARAATQSAEDARLLTLEKKRQEQAAAERQAAQDRIQQAQTQAEQEAARAQAAQDEARHEAEQRALAEQERQAAEQARLEAERAAQQAAQERTAAQQQLQQAQQERQALTQQQQALAQQAEQARLQAQQADQARIQAQQQAEQQRQRLLTQLNQVLQTRDSARGLIVNMSDVLFDLNKATLRPGAQIRLAKVAGIILAYPDLKLEIDGFTDSTGTVHYNQTLSDKRAQSVRDFLVAQGVPAANINTHGFGPANPVATNATAAGRQMNRRVELVVSGTAIGTNLAPAGGGGPATSSPGTIDNTGKTAPGTSGGTAGGNGNAGSSTPTGAAPGIGAGSGTAAGPASSTPSTSTPSTSSPAGAGNNTNTVQPAASQPSSQPATTPTGTPPATPGSTPPRR